MEAREVILLQSTALKAMEEGEVSPIKKQQMPPLQNNGLNTSEE